MTRNGARIEDANRRRHELTARYGLYEQLRTETGVVQTSTFAVVTGYQQVKDVLRNPEVFGSNVLEIQADVPLTRAVKQMLDNPLVARIVDPIPSVMRDPIAFQNGSHHEAARRVIAPSLRPALVEPLRERIRSTALSLLAANSTTGRMDVVRDFAAPLSSIVVCSLFGITTKEQPWVFRQLAPTIASARRASFFAGLATAPVMAASQRHLRRFFFEKLVDRPQHPGSPLLTAVLKRRQADGDVAAFAEFIALLNAGTATTQNLITSGVRLFLSDQNVLDQLRTGAVEFPAFREEVLRFESPVQVLFRLTQKPVDLAGVHIPSGHRVALAVGAANRDPKVFVDPGTLNLGRFDSAGAPVPPAATDVPLSFGDGIHFCPGFHLAGLEAGEAWSVMLNSLDDLELASTSLRTESGFATSGVEHLPIRFAPVDLGRSDGHGLGRSLESPSV